jgi:hypothetical protein
LDAQIDGYALAARSVHRAITTPARLLWPRPEPAIRGGLSAAVERTESVLYG